MRHTRLACPALVVVLAAAGAALASPVRITVNGDYNDWTAVPVAFADPAGDNGTSVVDFRTVWIANDDDYVYLRFEVGNLTNLFSNTVRLYFDIDQSAATGWPVGGIGSDFVLLIPEGRGAEQTASTFAAASLSHSTLGFYAAPTYAGTEFELRIRRSANLPVRGVPVFGGAAFDVVFEADATGGTPQDWAPDGPGHYSYSMATGSLPPYAGTPIPKADSSNVRLVTWNTLNDGLFVRPAPFDRILLALQPDIICFQEINSGSAAGVQSRLNSVLPLSGGASWQVYKGSDDVIASRWPLSMMADDTVPVTNRGQAMALVDLPDAQYRVNLYVISTHYKCCGSLGASEDADRQRHSDANVNWFRDLRTPGGSINLPVATPFVIAGDMNLVGGPRPLETLLTGDIYYEAAYGTDSPPDWNGSAIVAATPLQNAGPAAYTWRRDSSATPPSLLDFVVYSDSVLRVARSYILNTLDLSPSDLGLYGLASTDTAAASDHLPVVVDFDLTRHYREDFDDDGDVDLSDFGVFIGCYNGPNHPYAGPNCDTADLDADGDVDVSDFGVFLGCFNGPGQPPPLACF